MKSVKKSRHVLGAIAVMSVAAIALAGCSRGDAGGSGEGAASSPGISDDTLTLGITTPLSGSTAGQGTCSVAGITAYCAPVRPLSRVLLQWNVCSCCVRRTR